MDARQGDWVRIHRILLLPEERAPQVPPATAKVPLEMWVKGFLLNPEASVGEEVEVETMTGRRERGRLLETAPAYAHGWGECIPEILQIGRRLKKILSGEGEG